MENSFFFAPKTRVLKVEIHDPVQNEEELCVLQGEYVVFGIDVLKIRTLENGVMSEDHDERLNMNRWSLPSASIQRYSGERIDRHDD